MIHTHIKIPLLIIFILIPAVAFAETNITTQDIQRNWVWNKEGSPYILHEFVDIPYGHTLTMLEGTEVVTTKDSNGIILGKLGFVGGTLNILGTLENPVKITDLQQLYMSTNKSSINNAIFQRTGLDYRLSTSTIMNLTSVGEGTALKAMGSKIDITNSTFKNNSYGIWSYNIKPIFQTDLTFEDPQQNRITVRDSIFDDIASASIHNEVVTPIDARNNWWGSSDGSLKRTYGRVMSEPWLDHMPSPSTDTPEPVPIENAPCCSNVLFLPGIQASRLYKDSNKLWEPNRNEDVRKLHMNVHGKSIDSSIRAQDLLDTAFGIKNIYKSFIESMDDLVANTTIREWLPVPYDWRKGVYEIVNNDLITSVYKLADTSKTGKVTIIAHSNGGLVAKALIKELERQGAVGLIDKSIFIAVPELGTPQALLALLHGADQSIAGGLILSENNARNFSLNLPSAYGLLPTREFFTRNPMTVITDFFSEKLGTAISSYDGMKNFILSNSFSAASTTDIDTPLMLNSYLLSLNETFHLQADIWKPSSSTKTLSIFGWGIPTSKSITYEKDAHCRTGEKICDLSMFRTVTSSGDGTVMTATRSGSADETLFLNLKKLAEDSRKTIKHADILELKELRDFVIDEITEDSAHESYEKYFSTTEPTDIDKWLYVRVYSPVDIHIYDEKGNHTGLVDAETSEQTLEDHETEIPLSLYDGFGRTKQIILPFGQEYEIILDGTGDGVFTLETEVLEGDRVVASATFSELSVTSVLNAELQISTTTTAFASTTMLYIDSDGDGVSEAVHESDETLEIQKKDRKNPKKAKKNIKRVI